MCKMVMYDVFNFNPRSREGSDAKEDVDMLIQYDFNPRSREGSDDRRLGNEIYTRFQSTLPRGERL